jgi:hypothetical protein
LFSCLRNVAKLKNDLTMLFLDDQLHFLENHLALAMRVLLTTSEAFSSERAETAARCAPFARRAIT